MVSFPFVGDADLDALGLPADDPRRHVAAAGQPARQRGAGDDHHAAARPARRRPPATSAAAPPTWRSSRPAPSRCRGPPGPAPILRRRPAADRGRARRARQGAARTSRCTSAWSSRRRPRARRLVGRGPPGRLGRRGRRRPRASPSALGVEVDRPRRRARRPGTPAAAPRSWSATPSLGHAGELHPRVCAAFGLPPRTAAAEIDLDAPARARRSLIVRRRRSRPTRWPRRTSRSSSTTSVPRRRRRGGAARGRGRAAGVDPALRRLHRRRRSARARSRWPSRCASGRPTARSPSRRPAPPATPPSPLAAERTGAVQRAALTRSGRASRPVDRAQARAVIDRLVDHPPEVVDDHAGRRPGGSQSPSPRRHSQASSAPAGPLTTASGSTPGSATTWMSSSS